MKATPKSRRKRVSFKNWQLSDFKDIGSVSSAVEEVVDKYLQSLIDGYEKELREAVELVYNTALAKGSYVGLRLSAERPPLLVVRLEFEEGNEMPELTFGLMDLLHDFVHEERWQDSRAAAQEVAKVLRDLATAIEADVPPARSS